jgi:DNA-binding MarR family transcriptional regulator
MSTPPLPEGMKDDRVARAANALHSMSIHVLRSARAADKETGLSPERLSLLSVLAYAGPRTVSALAEIEGVSLPAISRTLKALEASGLASRARGEADAREVTARATPKGRRLMEKGRRRRLEIVAAMLRALSASELTAVEAAVSSVERAKRQII